MIAECNPPKKTPIVNFKKDHPIIIIVIVIIENICLGGSLIHLLL